jgi:hypothetical protein
VAVAPTSQNWQNPICAFTDAVPFLNEFAVAGTITVSGWIVPVQVICWPDEP